MKFVQQHLLALGVVLALSACGVVTLIPTTKTTYTHKGKTYVVTETRGVGDHDVTMFERVDGTGKLIGFQGYSIKDGKAEETEAYRNITTVRNDSVQVGDPVTTNTKQDFLLDTIDRMGGGGGGGGGSS